METAMPRLRIAVAGAFLVIALAGSAAAQTATEAAPGKPMPLLQILEKPLKAKSDPHRRTAKTARKATTRFAKRMTRRRTVIAREEATPPPSPAPDAAPAQTAIETAPANNWPQTNGPAGAAAAPMAYAPDRSAAGGAAADDSTLSEMVVGGQTVKIAPPDAVNDIDRAADEPDAAEDAALKSDFVQSAPPSQVMVAAPSQRDTSAVGSASWIARVLAAIGGAIAAGSTAWFMIGSTPRRTFG
jgi:hypothetical protein